MEEEKIYNYFYIVNNLLNGHFYLGVHSTDTLADGYMGSGDLIKQAIKNYGKENFELVPLKFFKTRKELMAYEREIVNERFLTHYKGICYNLKRGGEGGCEKKFSDEELVEHRKESQHKYNQSPAGKESQRKYNQQNKEHKHEYMCEYNQQHKEEIKESHRKYNQSPAGKEAQCKAQHKYNQSPAGKESQRKSNHKYKQSPAGKEAQCKAQRKYNQSPAGKESHRKYEQKPEAKARKDEYMREYYLKKKAAKLAVQQSTG